MLLAQSLAPGKVPCDTSLGGLGVAVWWITTYLGIVLSGHFLGGRAPHSFAEITVAVNDILSVLSSGDGLTLTLNFAGNLFPM